MLLDCADPAAGLSPITSEQLPDDVAMLKCMVLERLAALHQRDRDYEALRHRIDLLLRRLYGPRGERMTPTSSCCLRGIEPWAFCEMCRHDCRRCRLGSSAT